MVQQQPLHVQLKGQLQRRGSSRHHNERKLGHHRAQKMLGARAQRMTLGSSLRDLQRRMRQPTSLSVLLSRGPPQRLASLRPTPCKDPAVRALNLKPPAASLKPPAASLPRAAPNIADERRLTRMALAQRSEWLGRCRHLHARSPHGRDTRGRAQTSRRCCPSSRH